MRHKILAAVAAAAALSLSAPAGPAVAAEKCVTKTEYKKVEKGMKMTRVHNIFDSKGSQTFIGYGMQTRDYKPCSDPDFGFVTVDYEKKGGVWKVTGKYAYWG